MSDTKQLVTDLDKKVDQLLSSLNEAKTSNEKKDQEIKSLNDQLAEKDKEIKNLEENSGNQETVATVSENNSENTEEIKGRINELVKEIDNCISLLKV